MNTDEWADDILPGQVWRAVRATAEDVNHLLYTVESVEAGGVVMRRDDGKRIRMEPQYVRLYLDLFKQSPKNLNEVAVDSSSVEAAIRADQARVAPDHAPAV